MRCLFGMAMLVLGLFLCVQLANADVRRWDEKQQKVRPANEQIDIGDMNGGEDMHLFYWSLNCIDGVKVYTVFEKGSGLHSIIIPGPCEGQASKAKKPWEELDKVKERKEDNTGYLKSW